MEHKFRAWDEDHFVYSTDEPGNPPRDGESWFGFEKGVLKAWVSITETPSDYHEAPYPSAEELDCIEKYTGLKGKNGDGVEIWEGDVVESCWQVDHKVRIVGFVKYYSQFGLYSLENSKGDMVSPCWSDCKVIGNVHEDMDLLKETNND